MQHPWDSRCAKVFNVLTTNIMRNLLLPKDKKILYREYLLRLAVVVLVFLFFTLIAGIVFLSPSYFISQAKEKVISDQAEITKASIAAREQAASSVVLVEARQKLELLATHKAQPRITEIFRAVVLSKPDGIQIIGLLYRERGEPGGEVVVGGVASKREILLSFQKVLEQEPLFETVVLPVSVLAPDQDIEFTITINGSF